MYKVFFKKSAIKELKKIPKKEQILITKTIKTFSDDPHPVGHKKLVGEDITYRVRVGNYRIIYDI